jgi:hypothetical protein
MTSCNDDDYLKEKTESSFSYSNAFVVYTQVNDCLTEMYNRHQDAFFTDEAFLYGKGTDLFDVRCVPYSSTSNLINNFSLWSPEYTYPRNVFNRFYILIARANLVLYGAEQVSWNSESDKAYAIAQAKFMRGYSYMILGELFGGVPLVEEFSEAPKLDWQRASREDTYLFAISDLEAAVSVLPDHQTAGRVGKGAAWHFLAECYLALATIQGNSAAMLDKSIASAGEVMKYHSLMRERFGSRANSASTDSYNGVPSYVPEGDVIFDMFQRGNLDYEEGNTESLWVQQNDYDVFEKYGGATVSLPRWGGSVMRNVMWKDEWMEPGAGIGPWGTGILTDEWGQDMNICAYVGGRTVTSLNTSDYARNRVWENCGEDIRNSPVNIRRDFKVLDPNHSLYGFVLNEGNVHDYALPASWDEFVGAICTKTNAYDEWGYMGLSTGKDNRTNTFTDIYYARLAETYLLRAEAKFRKGDLADDDDINEIRGRAKAPLITAADVTIDYILDERVRELLFEERRWCTLLRMGGDVPNRITRYGRYIADYNPSCWTGTLRNDFLFPIPQTVIDSNLDAVIEQNPGW